MHKNIQPTNNLTNENEIFYFSIKKQRLPKIKIHNTSHKTVKY